MLVLNKNAPNNCSDREDEEEKDYDADIINEKFKNATMRVVKQSSSANIKNRRKEEQSRSMHIYCVFLLAITLVVIGFRLKVVGYGQDYVSINFVDSSGTRSTESQHYHDLSISSSSFHVRRNLQKDYLDILRKKLLPISGSTLFDTSSSQYKALEWIADNYYNTSDKNATYNTKDFDNYCINNSFFFEEMYVLAVLYYSAGGDEWNNSNVFLNTSKHICFWNNELTDLAGVYCDSTSTTITNLRLRNYNLRGTIPSEISYFSDIQRIRLENNHLMGTIPSEFGIFSNISTFDISNNKMFGKIPSELGNMGSKLLDGVLLYFALEENRLTGTIPTEIGKLPAMALRLYENELTGKIPLELTNLRNLTDFNLARNRLVGTIPTEIGQFSLLQFLRLEQNYLIGTIPTELGNLPPKTFRVLRLDENDLRGRMPREIVNLRGLTLLNIHRNNIEDDINSLFCEPLSIKGGPVYTQNISHNFRHLQVIRADTYCGGDDEVEEGTEEYVDADLYSKHDLMANVICTCCCCRCGLHFD